MSHSLNSAAATLIPVAKSNVRLATRRSVWFSDRIDEAYCQSVITSVVPAKGGTQGISETRDWIPAPVFTGVILGIAGRTE
ncbi:MAG: hypothetical protein HY913_05745 [Desulfomonile tiedjei]|nr:hypothetical protein [Desulfomonile tiedjei]